MAERFKVFVYHTRRYTSALLYLYLFVTDNYRIVIKIVTLGHWKC